MSDNILNIQLKKFPIHKMDLNSKVAVIGKPGTGKCICKGTLVMKYGGELTLIEKICKNDCLMGDDSTPRRVLDVHHGFEEMYDVIATNGEKYTVNKYHVLSLKCSISPHYVWNEKEHRYKVIWMENHNRKTKSLTVRPQNKSKRQLKTSYGTKEEAEQVALEFLSTLPNTLGGIIDISIEDYLDRPQWWKNKYKGYKVGVEFEPIKVDIDPYLLGAWLGDGSSGAAVITNVDKEVISYLDTYCKETGLCLRQKRYIEGRKNHYSYQLTSGKCDENGKWTNDCIHDNHFKQFLKNNNLLGHKHIPQNYKCNSREVRLKLLAGLIDTDGHYDKNGKGYEIIQKSHKLSNDIVYLGRSLGYWTTMNKCTKGCNTKNRYVSGTYYRMYISGNNLDEIPVLIPRKKAEKRKHSSDPLVYGIKVVPAGRGEYYGVHLDGNHRYLLGNFTVTHNSSLIEHLLYVHQYIPMGIALVGTLDGVEDMNRFMPDSFVYEGYNKDAVEHLLARQKKARRLLMKRGYTKRQIEKNPGWAAFLVMDDCMDDTKWLNQKCIKDIFKNGRHYNMFFIIAMQYCMSMTRALRTCLDYVFILKENAVSNRKRLYEHYCGVFPSFELFEQVLLACTENYECLVIDNRSTSNQIEDVIYWYKADLHDRVDWRIGGEEFWSYHNRKYDTHYDSDGDDPYEIPASYQARSRTRGRKNKPTLLIEKHGY